MKRHNNIYEQICSRDNLVAAAEIAQQGKKKQYGVKLFNQDPEGNIDLLWHMLTSKTYRTSSYETFTIEEPKVRLIYRLPFFPDRVAQHAAMRILERYFVNCFTADTYSCIKGRGIHAAARNLKKSLLDEPGTQYCLKLDIKKFYPSVDHQILIGLLERKFKDYNLLNFLGEIIESAPGLPIGNYLSQYLANFYLTYFDHWLKEVKGVRYYFRYCDDMVIPAGNKAYLHQLLADIREYLGVNLNLQVKDNYQVFPVDARGIDFVGYVFRHRYVLLRPSIKRNYARAVKAGKPQSTLASYYGWAKPCNSKHLLKKLGQNAAA